MAVDFELSEREIEIIRLVATGASNKEIAQSLVISPNTVKVHLRNIFAKLEVASRTEATMVAIREGWVSSPGAVEETEIDVDLPGSEIEFIEQPLSFESKPPWSKRLFTNLYFWGAVGISFIFLVLFLIFSEQLQPSNIVNTPTIQSGIVEESINRWETLKSIPEEMKGMAAARYEQSFYLIGGENGAGIHEHVWIYHLDTNIWQRGQNLPYPVANVQAAVLGELIYVPGGLTTGEIISDQFVQYDPRENVWKTLEPLPFGVSDYCMTAFEGKLYLFGGWDGHNFLDQILVYNPDDGVWESFGVLPSPRAACSVSVVGGKLHLFGGKNEQGILDNHEIFFPQRYLQNEDAWESAMELPEPRFGMGSTVLADMIYIAGGEGKNGQPMPLIQYFPPKNLWAVIDQPQDVVGSYPAVLPFETRLYVIGGETENQLQSHHQVYQAVYTILVPIVR